MVKWAKKVGKLDKRYEIPIEFTNNYPSSYLSVIKQYKEKGFFDTFPFGTDLTEDELLIGIALKKLKVELSSKFPLIPTLLKGIFMKAQGEEISLLERMNLHNPKNIKEWIYQKLLLSKLRG